MNPISFLVILEHLFYISIGFMLFGIGAFIWDWFERRK